MIGITRNSGVLELELARADKRNALTHEMYATLAAELRAAAGDEQLRAILIHGSSNIFCGGNDIVDFLERPPQPRDSAVRAFIDALVANPLPLVAAVEGPAIGIGTTLLLLCDLVYAGEGARLQMPFVALGLCPEAGSSQLLPALAGPRLAAELLVLGEPLDAQRAAAIGLINRALPAGQALDTARAQAQRLASLPPTALRETMALLRRNRSGLEETVEREFERFGQLLHGPEAQAALSAFTRRK
jgi:enoyl-CoA hydratase/carnithine racemase